ncbi:MAG TPA: 1-deoxy-D-xylulose-5-phosphate reductoisomerase [Rhizomicrobium sp.]|nr:1-deoxy-D-xylulose-5-phosphate reductoisomerase [Rhizomicrobium sp.]
MNALAATRSSLEITGLEPVLARSVTVLGSTGSIGISTLDVIAHARRVYGAHAMPVEAITAQSSVDALARQAREMKPKLAVIGDEKLYRDLKDALSGSGIEVAAGRAAIIEASARPSDTVMVAIMGAAALEPALAAVARSANVALANKECIVAAGSVFHRALANSSASVIPVDSEHNAVFQVLNGEGAQEVEKVTLTASGGPFRDWTIEQMAVCTVEQAVAHPNWSMGAKISVDSATLMNKGLELIEAHFLFALPVEKLDVLVHPQSIVHCLVSYADGSTLAHLSSPDMRTPIAHALAWPRRIASPSRRLDLAQVGQLTFRAPDRERFRCLGLALDAMRTGGMAPTILNAANEVAVDAFLNRRIGFLDIPRVVESTLDESPNANASVETLDGVLAVDARARDLAAGICRRVVN